MRLRIAGLWPLSDVLRTPDQKIDFGTSIVCLIVFFSLLIIMPRAWFWYWIVPLTAFWLRLNYVMLKREQLLDSRERPAGGDGTQGRIGIPDRSQEVAVPGEQLHSRPQPRRIIRRQ